MGHREVFFNLAVSDWLTIDANGSILSQVDEELSYPPDVILELVLNTFIKTVSGRTEDDQEVINYFAYYAKHYKINEEEKSVRIIALPEPLISTCNMLCQRINKIFIDSYPTLVCNLDILLTAALFDFRNRHYESRANSVSQKLTKHFDRHMKRASIFPTLLQQDVQIMEFIRLCVSYFKPKVEVEDLISLALSEWLKRNMRRETVDVCQDLSTTKKRFREKHSEVKRLYRFLKLRQIKDRHIFFIREDVSNGLNYLLFQVKEFDPAINYSVIVAEAIQQFKNRFVLDSAIGALQEIGKTKFRVI